MLSVANGLPLVLLTLAAVTALVTAAVLPPLMPLLRRYALARPNARSSHTVPTPQGGGIAVVGSVLAALVLLLPALGAGEARSLGVLAGAALVLAALGALDDVRPLSARARLLVQAACVAAVLWALPPEVRILPGLLPGWAERALLLVGGLWFVNLTNFMDGLDWMTVAGFVPLLAALACLAALGLSPAAGGLVAAALLGALLGFAPFNRPVARVFLGDVGSLPVGLLAGYALLRLGAAGHLAAALMLPLYYLVDATLTLLRRMAAGERFWDAHRSHFYQRATDRGLGVMGVIGRVLLANAVIALLAVVAVVRDGTGPALAALAAAAAAVVVLLSELSRPRRKAGAP